MNILKTSISRATSKTWTPDPGLGPWTRTVKNLVPGKHGMNIVLKNMSDFSIL